jgi:hypothetical protein
MSLIYWLFLVFFTQIRAGLFAGKLQIGVFEKFKELEELIVQTGGDFFELILSFISLVS